MDMLSFLMGKACGGSGGGSSVTVEALTATENKTYTAPEGKAYSPVTVNVPNSYSAGDEGKVVSNGALVAQSSDTVTQNGTVDTTLINSLLVNVSGGGGLEYESGTWTPNADTNHGSILFTKQHTSAPMFYAVLDTSDRSTLSPDTVIGCFYCDNYKMFGLGLPWGAATGSAMRYSTIQTLYRSNDTTQYQGSATGYNSDNSGDSSSNYPRFWAKETGIYPYAANDTRYYRSGHIFKWIAVFAPES